MNVIGPWKKSPQGGNLIVWEFPLGIVVCTEPHSPLTKKAPTHWVRFE